MRTEVRRDGRPATSIVVAAAQPVTVAHDVHANAVEHARIVRAAGARIVVFPELSLTGYELDAQSVPLDHAAWHVIVDACRETRSVALVGAPVADGGAHHIAVVRADSDGVRIVYRKRWLHGMEPQRFSPGRDVGVIVVDGLRVGLGICRDTKVAEHIDELARGGVDLYAAGVLDTPGEQQQRAATTAESARILGAPVVVASTAGAVTLYPKTAGRSAIHASDGTVLDVASASPGAFARAALTL